MARRPLTSPRKEASQERSKATVDTLLAATARVLVKDGYDRASTNKVAEAAGVSIGSLYQYFPSKEALVAAVIERHIAEMMEVVRNSLVRVALLPIEEAARELVRVMIDAHRIEPKLHRVLVEQIPRVGNLEQIESVDDEAIALVRAYLEAHKEEIDVVDLDLAASGAPRRRALPRRGRLARRAVPEGRASLLCCSSMSSIKKTLVQQGMKLMTDPRVMKMMQDERVMKAVMQMMNVPGKVQSFGNEQIEKLAKAMSLATEDEVKDLKRQIRRLEEEVSRLEKKKNGEG